MKIEFFNKETNEVLANQDDFRVDTWGDVYEIDYFCSFRKLTFVYNSVVGWRVIEENIK